MVYFFITEVRRAQFDLAMFILKHNIKLYEEIPDIKFIPTLFELPNNSTNYVNLGFFKNWIVGFTMSEDYFLIKK